MKRAEEPRDVPKRNHVSDVLHLQPNVTAAQAEPHRADCRKPVDLSAGSSNDLRLGGNPPKRVRTLTLNVSPSSDSTVWPSNA